MILKNKYQQAEEYIQLTPDMEQRILEKSELRAPPRFRRYSHSPPSPGVFPFPPPWPPALPWLSSPCSCIPA